jgi:Radial spokehead-like protein
LDEWFELPDISMDHLKASRLFKYYFTGLPYSEVSSFNYFPGYEIHLLKCQILRILHGSFIVPSGLYAIKSEVADDELQNKLTELDPNFVMPQIEELNSSEKWVHEYANILQSGRIIHLKAETEEAMVELLDKDKYLDRLSSISLESQIFK